MKAQWSPGRSGELPAGLRAALRAARGGAGRVSPNPQVGAALLLPGARICAAHHARFGGPHAEARLLDRIAPCGPLPAGAVLFVTLEPCCHHGKTPPCADRIVAARPARVVVAALDPDPRMRGKGIARIRAAGIPVEIGAGANIAIAQNLPYHFRQRTGRAELRLKLAASLDARLARTGGGSRWISGPEARRRVHRERAECDAVLVGSGTVLADRPRLTVRDAPGLDPSRIVVDSALRTPARGSVWRAWAGSRGGGTARRLASVPAGARRIGNYQEAPATGGARWIRRPRLILATVREQSAEAHERAGWEVWRLPERDGRVSLRALLRRAAEEGFLQVLAEAGARLAGALLQADLVDEISLYVAPAVLGAGPTWPAAAGTRRFTERSYELVATERLGEDLRVELRRRGLLERLASGPEERASRRGGGS